MQRNPQHIAPAGTVASLPEAASERPNAATPLGVRLPHDHMRCNVHVA